MHEKLVRKGGVSSVLILLRDSQDDMCRRMACLALANIASHVFTRVSARARTTPPRADAHTLRVPTLEGCAKAAARV